ncbi:MAG: hypothetical protein KGI72_05880 [Patescibacteria group bacterium]|nr:hypothetical protein [Patescibacteria group bacterium]
MTKIEICHRCRQPLVKIRRKESPNYRADRICGNPECPVGVNLAKVGTWEKIKQ